jgi:hypothetical protein
MQASGVFVKNGLRLEGCLFVAAGSASALGLRVSVPSREPRAASLKHQASSLKPGASSLKPGASSRKPRAVSKNHPFIPHPPSDALTVEVLEQRHRVLARETRELLELTDAELRVCALARAHL